MEAFTTITGYAAPMPQSNINTDMITPGYILKEVTKTGLSWGLFREYRFNSDGSENPEHILNRDPWRNAKIIVALENWGCGSSRECAPWAMFDFGLRCVIAISFADIHHNNCYKNGILPVALTADQVDRVMIDAEAGLQITVDLPSQIVRLADGTEFGFDITPLRKKCLLEGLDDIGMTAEHTDKITDFEAGQRSQLPWLYDRQPLDS